ncbi:protein DEK-like protein [Carex littledalei]|uniref:Protein DEK-like protein n=1 Tax=Carex littledalei TaxID=544730 RepID=A0A833VDY4_9POAL|nr:protein DEK-like protein [Carex littledalei]
MDQAPLGIEKAREERINSNKERMKQLGIINLSRDINSEAKEKRKRGRKKKEDVEGSEAKEVKEEEKKEKGMERKGERTSSRERKAVERYSVIGSPRSGSGKKGISIVQGSGTKLKDIPNVSFKLSKRRADETLHSLYVLLFGRRSSAFHLKRNIFQFSGFVWTDDKTKMRLKKKIDKFSNDKLCEFCELLDIPISKASKKEEITGKLIEFLESPHVTSGGAKRRKKSSEKQAAEPEQEDVDEESDSEGEVGPADSEEEPAEDHITGKDNKEDKESKKGQEVEEEEEDKEETKGKEKKKEKGHNLK